MASFSTHLVVATVASASIAVLATSVQLIALKDSLEFIFLGIIGGLLPDIDSRHSKPAKLIFNTLGVLIAFTALWFYKSDYAIQYLVVIAISSFVFVRYIIFALFTRLTIHRGIFHSLLAAAFFALLSICISYYLLHCRVLQAWLGGCFVAFGFIIHLLLDECYSVDLANKRIKKSFGTALKLWNYKNLTASLIMALLTLLLYGIAPPAQTLITAYNTINWQDYLIRPVTAGDSK